MVGEEDAGRRKVGWEGGDRRAGRWEEKGWDGREKRR